MGGRGGAAWVVVSPGEEAGPAGEPGTREAAEADGRGTETGGGPGTGVAERGVETGV